MAAYLHAARRLLQSGVTSERLMDTLNKAEAESQRTREVLERIREFVSNGKMDLQPLDLSALVRKIATLCREDAAARGNSSRDRRHPSCPPGQGGQNPDRASFEQSRRQRDRRGLRADGLARACDHTRRHARR